MATSTADSTKTASAMVKVLDFLVSPASALVAPGATQQFSATIPVTWSVDGVAGGNGTTGTINSNGMYAAPLATGAHTVMATSAPDPTTVSVSAAVTVINSSSGAVLTYHNDNARDGAFMKETVLMPSNVSSSHFGKLVSYPVDGQIYAQPLYLPQLSTAGGTHDVVYTATQNKHCLRLRCNWCANRALLAGQPRSARHQGRCDRRQPYVGILSTPVIDASTNTIYVVAEESGTNDPSPFYLHALDVATGLEKFGGPVNITGSVTGTEGTGSSHTITLEASCYQRMGLALNPVTNAIYIAFGSCTHGWVLAYDKTNLAQKAIFNDTPDGNGGGGLWASGGAPAIDDTTGDLYLMSGVDLGDQITSGYNNSFLRLDD